MTVTYETTNEQVQEAREIVEDIASLALSIRGMVATLVTATADTEAQAEARAERAAEALCGPIQALTNQIGFMADRCCGLLDGSDEAAVLGDATDWLLSRHLIGYTVKRESEVKSPLQRRKRIAVAS